MNSARIHQIQQETAYAESNSVRMALLQVWNEVQQEANKDITTARAEGYAQGVEDSAKLRDFAQWCINNWQCDRAGEAYTEVFCGSPQCRRCSAIRALAPAAPVILAPARTYEDGMRDAAGIAKERGITMGSLQCRYAYDDILAAAGNPPTVGKVATCEYAARPHKGFYKISCLKSERQTGWRMRPHATGEECPYCHKPISIKEAL